MQEQLKDYIEKYLLDLPLISDIDLKISGNMIFWNLSTEKILMLRQAIIHHFITLRQFSNLEIISSFNPVSEQKKLS